MLKCRVFHVHTIKVLRQSEMIPKLPRWFGSGIHICEGLLGVVGLVAGSSIYFVDK